MSRLSDPSALVLDAPLNNHADNAITGATGTWTGESYVAGPRGRRAADFDGVNDKIAFGDIGIIRSLAFWVKPTSTTEEMILIDTGSDIMVSAGTITYATVAATATYVNGKASTALIAGAWQHVVCVLSADVDANIFEMANDGSNFGALAMADLLAYSVSLTALEAKELFLRPAPRG